MSSLAFYAADTLGMELLCQDDALWGEQAKYALFPPWKVEFSQEAFSDVINAKEVGFWVSMSGSLWFYLVIRNKESYLLVLDAATLGITSENYSTFSGGSVKETILKVKHHIKATFRWDSTWCQETTDWINLK